MAKAKEKELLPASLREFSDVDEFSVPPAMSRRELIKRTREAKRLSELCEGQLKVEFCPTTTLCEDDEPCPNGTTGWVYRVQVADRDDRYGMEFLSLDGRSDLVPQLVRELQRVGEWYLAMARQVEKKALTKKPCDQFEVALISREAASGAESVYKASTLREAIAWVKEWIREPLDLGAVIFAPKTRKRGAK